MTVHASGGATSIAARFWAGLSLAGVLLSACSSPTGAVGPQAWIDAPMDQSRHPLAPLEVVLHAADPGGVAMVELSINDEVLSRRPPDSTSEELVTVRIDWDPQAAGDYMLVARAQNQAGAWSGQASSRVTIGPAAVRPGGPVTVLTPTFTPTGAQLVTPTWTPAPACVDQAAFVADVTIPDNTQMASGQSFTKVWRLRNDGTCPWNEEYQVVFVDGAAMSNNTPLSIANTVQPGATVDLSVELVAPSSAGTYTGNYQIRNPQGDLFGVGGNGQTPFYVRIVVGAPSGPSPTAPPPPPDTQPPSVSVSHSPSGGSIPTGTSITFSANASDNVGVTRIDLWVTAPGGWPTKVKTCNNKNTCSYTGGPYTSAGNLSYFAVAADAAGHETNSSAGTIVLYVVISWLPANGSS
jgi:hypothetical protein